MNDYGLYYGLPQSVWSGLCDRAEEIFYEEAIGQVILGIYPSGNRIFGIEAEAPHLLCLYLDSEEDILNPLKKNLVRSLPTGDSSSYIHFEDLWHWISRFNQKSIDIDCLIPCYHDAVYEEGLIEEVLAATRSYLESLRSYSSYTSPHVLGNRTLFLFQREGVFVPNINPDWDKTLILEIDEEIEKMDLQIREHFLGEITIPEDFLTVLSDIYNDTLSEIYKKTSAPFYRSNADQISQRFGALGKTVSSFYRSIL